MKNLIVLTMKEQRRVEVIQRVFRGEMTMAEAALVLGGTERQSFSLRLIRPLAESDQGQDERGAPLLS